ncbi:MAG: TetR/AcrR family transcriptional regulator [Caulobacteraceae bacterium]
MSVHGRSSTKDRLLRAGERLFRAQGYSATGLKQLGAAAEAPWGSIYHFFPGGKEQLGAEVVRYAGQLYLGGWRAAFDRCADPARALEGIFTAEARILAATDYGAGCPVASVTLDTANTSEELRGACAGAFAAWLAAITEGLGAAGAPKLEATALAAFVLSALEGAIMLSRAAKDSAPLVQSGRFVREAIERRQAAWRADNRAAMEE